MRSLIRAALVFVCLAIVATAQTDIWKYSKTAALSGASTAFTITLPATGENQVDLLDMVVQCTADCFVSTERNGTAPTGTAGVWRAEDPSTAPGVTTTKALIFHNSDSASGTTSDEAFLFPATAIIPWEFGSIRLSGNGLTKNFTVRIGPMTGTYRFQIRARVRR